MRTGLANRLNQRWTQALTRHLKQAEMTDIAHLDTRSIIAHGIFKAAFNRMLIAIFFHIDEINHNQAREVAQF